MSAETSIRINFGRPMPILPLGTVTLLPKGVLPIHVDQPRDLQLVRDALDGPGQLAMGVYRSPHPRGPLDNQGALRPAVCIGHIIEHHKLPDGRYNVALHGVCRARILHELDPEPGILYRRAALEPVDEPTVDDLPLTDVRDELVRMLDAGPLATLRDAALIAKHVKDRDIPSAAIIELLSLTFISDSEVRYRLLAEGDATRRGSIVLGELGKLERLLRQAEPQRSSDAPRGCSWN
jgi:Lon protease-like protein